MGTRAQFFIGDPRDTENREWLGTVAFDGYPDGDIGDALLGVADEQAFRTAIAGIKEARDDFADPAKRSYPFPWRDDLFLTDCTYAWFGGSVMFTYFHRGFVPLAAYLGDADLRERYGDQAEELSGNVPAPEASAGLPAGPDSILVVSF